MADLAIMVMSGPDDGQVLYLDQVRDGQLGSDGTWSILFGRREECDVSIPFDTQVSRRHAYLRMQPDGRFVLEDVGSLNGTFLDRSKTRIEEPVFVGRGQLFRLGRTWMRIQADGEDES
ncbi:MAG: FHA domain-containing protein [Anaerolineae bacterium]|nr:FHA domain-containing protein [Anaerolineae bacterium]